MKIKELMSNSKDYLEFNMEASAKEGLAVKTLCSKLGVPVSEMVRLTFVWLALHQKDAFEFVKERRGDRCEIGMRGKPKFKYDDAVGFYMKPSAKEPEIYCVGSIYVIDAYGNGTEPTYDIATENFNKSGKTCIVHGVPESDCCTLKFY